MCPWHFFLTTRLRQHPDNTGTLPCPIICVRIVQFQLILPRHDNTSWLRYGYPRLTTSSLYLSQEWHLMCSHYIILVAFKGSCQSIRDELFRQQTGTKIIFVKGPGTQYNIVGQITPPLNFRGGRGEHPFHKNGRVLFQIRSNPRMRRFRGRSCEVVAYVNWITWALSSGKRSLNI